jgi:hypothetical protein
LACFIDYAILDKLTVCPAIFARRQGMYQLTKYFVPIFAVVGAIIGLSLTGTGPGLLIGTAIGGFIGGVAGLVIRRL